MEAWIIWLIVAAVLIVVEVLSQMMWALCLTVGAVGAMLCSLFGLDLSWQVGVMAAMSLAAYLILLPIFNRRHARKAVGSARTGMDALLGRHAVVTHAIHPGALGRVRIDGDNWQVRAPGCADTITAGSEVSVTGYDSIILTVERL